MSNVSQVITKFAVLVGADDSGLDSDFVMQNQPCHKLKYINV